MLSEDGKYIFLHVPKTAGTSIKKMLGLPTSGRLMHLTAQRAKRYYRKNWDSAFKFSFVRNPWSRAVSIFYYYKTQPQKHKIHDTFEEFCHDLDNNLKALGLNYNQLDFLSIDGRVAVDFLGRVETLKDDCKVLFDILSLESRGIPKVRMTKHPNCGELYDDETRNIVGRYFARDVEELQYKFDGEL